MVILYKEMVMRIIVTVIVLAAIAYLGWYVYEAYTAPEATAVIEEVTVVGAPAGAQAE